MFMLEPAIMFTNSEARMECVNSLMLIMLSLFSPSEYRFMTRPPFAWSMSNKPSTMRRMMTIPGDFLRPDS